MVHLLKIKCVDSRVNVRILASTNVPFTLTDGASAKFLTNSRETDNSIAGSVGGGPQSYDAEIV
jgi:hypothetical protein